tara:strand:- start:304 stop:519 length:216 start_codon:yes stop_codon:yes gene_type:complete
VCIASKSAKRNLNQTKEKQMNNQNQINNLRSVATRQNEEFKKLLAAGQGELAMLKFNQHTSTIHAISRLES